MPSILTIEGNALNVSTAMTPHDAPDMVVRVLGGRSALRAQHQRHMPLNLNEAGARKEGLLSV